MAARTLDNCRLVTAYGRPRQYDGKCEGYGIDYDNDEPCEICKQCRLHYLNAEQKIKVAGRTGGKECYGEINENI